MNNCVLFLRSKINQISTDNHLSDALAPPRLFFQQRMPLQHCVQACHRFAEILHKFPGCLWVQQLILDMRSILQDLIAGLFGQHDSILLHPNRSIIISKASSMGTLSPAFAWRIPSVIVALNSASVMASRVLGIVGTVTGNGIPLCRITCR